MQGFRSISTHPLDRNYYKKIVLAGSVITVVFIVTLVFTAVRRNVDFPVAVLVTLGLILGVPIIIGLFVWWRYHIWLNPQLDLYDNGVNYTDKHGEKFWTWSDIQVQAPRISGNVQMPFPPLLLVAQEGQKKIKLDNRYQNINGFIKAVVDNLLKERNYEQIYSSGQIISVGKIEINQSGIQISDKPLIQWETIAGITHLNFNRLDILRSTGGVVSVKMTNVPDAPLLIKYLIQKISGATKTGDETTQAPQLKLADSFRSRLILRGSVYSVIFSVILLAISVYVYGTGIINLMTYQYIPPSTYYLGLGGLLAPIAALWSLYMDTHKLLAREEIIVGKDGLGYKTRSGEKYWSWEQVEGARVMKDYNKMGSVYITYDVLVDEDTILRLHPQFEHYGDVANAIQVQHTQAHLSKVKEQIKAGEVLDFDPILVDQFGIRYAGKNYVWDEMKSVEMSNAGGETHLVITSKDVGKFRFSVSIFGMKNSMLLYHLLYEHLMDKKPPAQ